MDSGQNIKLDDLGTISFRFTTDEPHECASMCAATTECHCFVVAARNVRTTARRALRRTDALSVREAPHQLAALTSLHRHSASDDTSSHQPNPQTCYFRGGPTHEPRKMAANRETSPGVTLYIIIPELNVLLTLTYLTLIVAVVLMFTAVVLMFTVYKAKVRPARFVRRWSVQLDGSWLFAGPYVAAAACDRPAPVVIADRGDGRQDLSADG